MNTNRAGVFMKQPSGYVAFIPNPLPPEPQINVDNEMFRLLSDADRKLGRLDGITQILPNPELFVAMYVQKEALLSSQIEGTQASLIDVLGKEDGSTDKKASVIDVVNYVNAMYYGLDRLNQLPLCLRLLREIHGQLLANGRGSSRNPGDFRSTQNWIGPSGCDLMTATFVPPPVPEMLEALDRLEFFFHQEDDIPSLIKIGMIHAQFETIHPFLDGNGRMGRLLITFWLCQQGILSQPLLYLSYYFKLNRLEYYDRLMAVRTKGDWEGWLKFFLKGVATVADEATEAAKHIIALREECKTKVNDKNSTNHQKLLDLIFLHPVLTVNKVCELLDISYPTANRIVSEFCEWGILKPLFTEKVRNRKYCFDRYLAILGKGTE
jgi:Fic family protein